MCWSQSTLSLADLGRRLKGAAQTINLGADIFLADGANCYLGRICHYRECHARAACQVLHCGRRQHLNDDLLIVALCPALVSTPPIELWPRVCHTLCRAGRHGRDLMAELAKDGTPRDWNAPTARDPN